MKRLVIIYNPQSSRYMRVRREVLGKVPEGYEAEKFEIIRAGVMENARRLKEVLRDGDLVVTAGGDGTVAVAVNGIMESGKEVELGVLPYGNFNDLAKTLKTKKLDAVLEAEAAKMWPLEAMIDGKRWRYGASYFTLGLFAESCEVFNQKGMRKILKKGNKTPVYSWLTLMGWYFRNRKRKFLPELKLDGKKMDDKTTDVMAVNGWRVAGAMRGGKWYLIDKEFCVTTAKNGKFCKLVGLMTRSILDRIPGKNASTSALEFLEPGEFEIQADGEYERVSGAKKVEIKKAGKYILVRSRRVLY